ncbi:MAG: superoxide dismutase [Candidatus Brockarchaeota archaeon]|nr:superoxide dismutase [Candidatus Brockarchaeota archaeon]
MYQPKSFEHLLGLKGFSDQLLKNHFTLYQGYVNNTNKLIDALAALLKEGKTGSPEYAELKRRLGWEWNGMRLHEYYFGNMAKDSVELDKDSRLYRRIVEDFGSYENWEKDFKAVGTMRGIGWVTLYYDPAAGRLLNAWINEHDAGHFSGANPILIMDVFEHAYMIDYGLKRADYVEAFFKAIDWKTVEERFEKA